MSVTTILERFRERGVRFQARLKVTCPSGELTAAEWERLAELKPLLLYLLSLELLTESLTPDLRELLEERAAVREFDGKLPRADAELLALLDVLAVALQRASTATVQPSARTA